MLRAPILLQGCLFLFVSFFFFTVLAKVGSNILDLYYFKILLQPGSDINFLTVKEFATRRCNPLHLRRTCDGVIRVDKRCRSCTMRTDMLYRWVARGVNGGDEILRYIQSYLMKIVPARYLCLGIFFSSMASISFFLWKCGANSANHFGSMGITPRMYSLVVWTSSK